MKEFSEDQALEKLLHLGDHSNSIYGNRRMIAGLCGDISACQALAEKEAQSVYPQGALVIDCEDINMSDLIKTSSGTKGKVVEAFEAGQPVILVNVSKAQKGTIHSDLFVNFVKLLSDEIESFTDGEMEVNRAKTKPSFRVRVIGDKESYGGLSRSVNARLDPIAVASQKKDTKPVRASTLKM